MISQEEKFGSIVAEFAEILKDIDLTNEKEENLLNFILEVYKVGHSNGYKEASLSL